MSEATAPQATRARALVLWMGGCAALGVLSVVSPLAPRGAAPAPCAQPARRDGLLACDGVGAAPRARAWLVGHKLDVNTATRADLEAISGVGPSLAGAILDARDARGRFDSLAQLDDVPGVGEKTLRKLERYLDVR